MNARVARDGFKAASKWYVGALEDTKAFRYAYLDAIERDLDAKDVRALRKAVKKAYAARGKKWKDEKELADRYAREL